MFSANFARSQGIRMLSASSNKNKLPFILSTRIGIIVETASSLLFLSVVAPLSQNLSQLNTSRSDNMIRNYSCSLSPYRPKQICRRVCQVNYIRTHSVCSLSFCYHYITGCIQRRDQDHQIYKLSGPLQKVIDKLLAKWQSGSDLTS